MDLTDKPFRFYTHLRLAELTGFKIHDLAELLEAIKTVPESVMYNHTHHVLKQHQYPLSESPGDFACWVSNVLKEDRLGKQLSSVDITLSPTIKDLRDRLRRIIEEHLARSKNLRTAPDGDELHLLKTRSFIMSTPYAARNLEEFSQCLKSVTLDSLYFHLFDARLRLENGKNDFSAWIDQVMGKPELAAAVAKMDPYTETLREIRGRICTLVDMHISSHNRKASPEMAHADA